ncbi:MAG: hypothetical protein EB149_00570 [Thaumarchaeota archaeon]|nr:hypothetical protein [Nitrososphaerota archaeon]
MKTALTFALFALVASMIIAPAFADSKLDSFVNLASQARTQVKIQLDKMPSAPDDVKSQYAQGDSETEQLIASVKKGDAAEAKKHFLLAMKAFRQVTQYFSDAPTTVSALPINPPAASKIAPPTDQAPDFDYGNALKRFEANIAILKAVAAKNNLQVDFGKIDSLLQTAKANLASGDMVTLEKTFADLKAAGTDLQTSIKDMVRTRSDTRAVSFANKYTSKIDAVLAQAKDLNLSEDQITKLQKAKEELSSSGGDPSQMVIKIKRVYQINLDLLDAKNQKIISEISKQESRLALLEPKIDSTIQPKFDAAKAILASLKDPTSTDDPIKLLRSLDSTLREIESYFMSQQQTDQKTADVPKLDQSQPADTKSQVDTLKADGKQDRQKGKDGKGQRLNSEISKLEAKLAELEPQIDDTIKPKFDSAKSMLAKLKDTGADSKKTLKAINSLVDEISQYVDSNSEDN